ncbi:terpene synthase [Chitinophaga varians]|uniref:Terpene synthase n=1 Tax=Chitinophaga varians TaxID=2202339 RepID=A0A847S8L9_9BACT|nr:terpene synthase [Chitinophaga varians]NLR68061.1 terpene synthase [Chitinophaga varians]
MNTKKILNDRFNYPFPDMISPFAAILQEVTDTQWIDGELKDLIPYSTREKYKRTKTGFMSARWWPTTRSFDRMLPLGRFMLWSMYNDDMYEIATAAEVRNAQERSIAVLKGRITPEEAQIPLAYQLYAIREGFLQFIPETSMDRFANTLNDYFDGLEMEVIYKQHKIFPTVGNLLNVRVRILMICAFIETIEIQNEVTLPDNIYSHPVIKRLYDLTTRIIGYFNDVQSLLKDEESGEIYFNVVKVLQHHCQLSREDALEETIRMHNADLEEFHRLRASLPDFGEWNNAVDGLVTGMVFFIKGWQSVSLLETERYGANGFPQIKELPKV